MRGSDRTYVPGMSVGNVVEWIRERDELKYFAMHSNQARDLIERYAAARVKELEERVKVLSDALRDLRDEVSGGYENGVETLKPYIDQDCVLRVEAALNAAKE